MTKSDISDIRGAVKEEIKIALEPIKKTVEETENNLEAVQKAVNENTRKLDILWDQVKIVTVGLEEIKEDHGAALKRIEEKLEIKTDDIKKLDKRVIVVESQLGVVAPPELTIP